MTRVAAGTLLVALVAFGCNGTRDEEPADSEVGSESALETDTCDARREVSIDEQTFAPLAERVQLYVSAIDADSSAATWKPFRLRLLVGSFRQPMLVERGFLLEHHLGELMMNRRDVTVTVLDVAGSDELDPKKGPLKTFGFTPAGTATRSTVQLLRIEPSAQGKQRVVLGVCAPAAS